MLKSSLPYIIYLILSGLIIFFAHDIHDAAMAVAAFYRYIDAHIDVLFSHSSSGISLRHVVALIACPLIITGIPATVYHAIQRKPMPYFMEITWLVWIVIVLSNVLVR